MAASTATAKHKPPKAWKPGQSGNPNGRPKRAMFNGITIQELAREASPKAIASLIKLAENAESESARVAAANSILDRGWGRPAQSVTLSGDPANPLHVKPDLSGLTDDQLRTLASIKLGD